MSISIREANDNNKKLLLLPLLHFFPLLLTINVTGIHKLNESISF